MKKFSLIVFLFAAALCGLPAAAQSICFWTDDADAVPVRIYVDHEYFGDITVAYQEQPLLDAEGCVSVDTTPDRHELTAVDKYGRVYKGWPGWIRPRTDKVNYLKLRAGQFRSVDRDGWELVLDLGDESVKATTRCSNLHPGDLVARLTRADIRKIGGIIRVIEHQQCHGRGLPRGLDAEIPGLSLGLEVQLEALDCCHGTHAIGPVGLTGEEAILDQFLLESDDIVPL